MSDYVEDSRRCEATQDELAELALGILDGRSRAEGLGHVADCQRCSSELEHLSMVADGLLQLAPVAEPPLGFELRVAERLKAAAARVPRRQRLRRVSLLSAAAVVLVALGFGIGALVAPNKYNRPTQSATANLTSANLTSHGQVLGEVIISAGTPSWMFMTIENSAWSGEVTCDVTLAGGKVETIGMFKLSAGYGAWATPLNVSAGKVLSASLIATNGDVLASARLAV